MANEIEPYAIPTNIWDETKYYYVDLDEGGYVRIKVVLNFVEDHITTSMTIKSITCEAMNSATTLNSFTWTHKGSTCTSLDVTNIMLPECTLYTTCNGTRYKTVYRIEYQSNRLVTRYVYSGPVIV